MGTGWLVVVLLLLLLVGLLVAVRMDADGPVELLAWVLLGALGGAPVVAVGTAWVVPMFITPTLVGGLAALLAGGLLVAGGVQALREYPWRGPTESEALVLLAAAMVGAVTASLHTDVELMLSLASWLRTGEAECFYMQTFSLVGDLNQGGSPDRIRDAWQIVNSPGNTAYTAALMPTLDGATFRIVDVIFRVLLFLFVQLALVRWTRFLISLVAALFVVLNPFMLYVEVLDRNVIAAALTAALLFALRARPDKALAHGLLLGLLAISGLRFLPLVFAVPVFIVHGTRGSNRREWGAVLGGFVLPFAVGVPHLQHHGLHSMGETESWWELLQLTLEELPRTPFLPFPTGAYYYLTVLDFLGLGVCALAAMGASRSFRREPAWGVGLTLPLLGILAALSVQRDWIQGDKVRIALEALVPVVVLAALGLDELFDRYRRRIALAELAAAAVVLLALGFVTARLDVPVDASTYLRHPVHQTETDARLAPSRAAVARFGLLPDYGRLATKLDVGRKRAEEASVRWTVYGPGSPLADRPREADWWGGGEASEPLVVLADERSVLLEIDLALLPTAPDDAVREVASGAPFVDLIDRGKLLDIYFRSVVVPWQPQPLGIAALPLRAEVDGLGELYLDLNAFGSLGTDRDGFTRVGPIHLRSDHGGSVLTALPDASSDSTIRVRVPRNYRVLVRDWLVDSNAGTPHRVDSWTVTVDDGGVHVGYGWGEPESYL